MPKQKPTTREEAQLYAIEWQEWAGEQILSWGEFSEWANHFEEIAKEFDLIDEFKENGII